MSRQKQITIVGAGLVGSLLAVLLGNRGYKVRVLEQRADMRDKRVEGGRSINLALAERGIHALEKAGLMGQVRPLLIPMGGRMLHDRAGNLEYLPYGQRPEEVIYSVSRGGLNKLMMTAAEGSRQVEIHFNQSLETIDFENQKISVRDALSAETSVLDYEILIGADGGGSRVRRAILSLANGQDNSQLLDHDYKELTIPAGEGGKHLIEREALHIWPRGGFMLIALPNLDGSFTVTLFLQKKGAPSFESLNNQSTLLEFFKTEFADALDLIPCLADEYFDNPQGILGTVRCRPWSFKGNVMLIGDASHAVVPFHGQGMNAGFEDAELFLDLLDNHNDSWVDAIEQFDQTRRPDANAIADMALENYVTMRDSVRDPKFALKKELGFQLEREFPNRFIPRYSMVMFHRIPYSAAFARGKIQDAILNQLIDGKAAMEDVDFDRARKLVELQLDEINPSVA